MKKQTKKQMREFNQEVIKILEFHGAYQVEGSTSMITYQMNSDKLGILNIKLDYDPSQVYTILTRFEDVDKAKKYFSCNPYTGKHNSHEYDPQECIFFIDSLLDNYNLINGIDKFEKSSSV